MLELIVLCVIDVSGVLNWKVPLRKYTGKKKVAGNGERVQWSIKHLGFCSRSYFLGWLFYA